VIRPLAVEDITPLAARLAPLPLLQRYRTTEVGLAGSLGKALDRGDEQAVADDTSGPVGLAWFLAGGTFALGGYLRLLAIAEKASGGGLGSALLAGYEAGVAARSKHAFLLVSDFNEGAQRFYQRHGYTQCGALPGLVVPEITELIYWKRLA
jgi:ribosomal protein S18 acetylase RimI-like enzyme